MLIGALAALAAALCWTLASSLWRRLPTSLSGAELNLLKNWLALAMLLPLVMGRAWPVAPGPLLLLALSGVLGIAVGDSLYFAALRRLGTRRTLTIDAGGPAVASLGGMVWLAEVPEPLHWLGLGLITLALLLVAGQRAGDAAAGRQQLQGVLLALGALLCGSAGALVSRAALRDGAFDPLQSALVRVLAAGVVLLPLLRGWRTRDWGPRPSARRWPLGLLATLLGTTLGIALQQLALQRLPGGMAVALLATAPLMAIPLAHLEGDQPGWRGWLAALLALSGVTALVA
ncbi:MAG: DMT family transporter [Cyanobacteria bacterium M_surface_7_m2_037]|nr:DMT family transporter [Cyanobacteria bacterium M_surface_7_m2_037]